MTSSYDPFASLCHTQGTWVLLDQTTSFTLQSQSWSSGSSRNLIQSIRNTSDRNNSSSCAFSALYSCRRPESPWQTCTHGRKAYVDSGSTPTWTKNQALSSPASSPFWMHDAHLSQPCLPRGTCLKTRG